MKVDGSVTIRLRQWKNVCHVVSDAQGWDASTSSQVNSDCCQYLSPVPFLSVICHVCLSQCPVSYDWPDHSPRYLQILVNWLPLYQIRMRIDSQIMWLTSTLVLLFYLLIKSVIIFYHSFPTWRYSTSTWTEQWTVRTQKSSNLFQ